MPTLYVKCARTAGNRHQACALVLVGDRLACLPTGPAENAAGKIAGALAMTALGIDSLRLGERGVDLGQLATPEQLDAAVAASGGFYLGADWTYRTRLPVIGTMLMRGEEVITARERVPKEMLARLTRSRAPPSVRPVLVAFGVGGAILLAAGLAYLASGSLEVLLGIGFWGVLVIGSALYAWTRFPPR